MRTTEKVDELKGILEATEIADLERSTTYRLSDAIREGSTITEKANGWGEGDSACALHAAVISAAARGYIK
jgi:hypothetical protein